MSWLWWLLAPVCSTAVGATLLWARAQAATRRTVHPSDPIGQHHTLLAVLAAGHSDQPAPSTMIVLDVPDVPSPGPVEEAPLVAG